MPNGSRPARGGWEKPLVLCTGTFSGTGMLVSRRAGKSTAGVRAWTRNQGRKV